jgi:hypothetical protein
MKNTNPGICLAGMHRSGTSMVARVLHDCGLYLGPQEELGFDASDGERHWENIRFVALNEKILNRLGGAWHNPPKLPAGWECKPEVQSLTLPAKKLIAMLSRDHQLWGWKDPRNSLTVPFWRALIPELKVVICVRNPLETSRSLQARGDAIAMGAFQLWLTYYRELLVALPPERRVVTHYESYFPDPADELLRVANAINLKVSPGTIHDAGAGVDDNLRHHRAKTGELAGSSLSREVRDLYLDLCSEAGIDLPAGGWN